VVLGVIVTTLLLILVKFVGYLIFKYSIIWFAVVELIQIFTVSAPDGTLPAKLNDVSIIT